MSSYTQIMTHVAYPGFLFVSTNTEIYIVNTMFYLEESHIYSSLKIRDPKGFQFVVSRSALVVFLESNGEVIEYDLSNLENPTKTHVYGLFGYTPILTPYAINYSNNTDLIYVPATSSNGESQVLLCLSPSSIGNSNLRYAIPIPNSGISTTAYIVTSTPWN